MRCEDEYTQNGDTYGLYNQEDPRDEFKKFLSKAEKSKVLPEWWSKEKKKEVMRMSTDRDGDACIHHAVEKGDVVDMYEDGMMPMKLRALGEKVYGKAVSKWGM